MKRLLKYYTANLNKESVNFVLKEVSIEMFSKYYSFSFEYWKTNEFIGKVVIIFLNRLLFFISKNRKQGEAEAVPDSVKS